MKLPWLILVTMLCALIAVRATDYYVSPAGDDTAGTGSLSAPFRTIQRAANVAVAGDNVIIRAGTYRETVRPANSGLSTSRITYKAYETDGVYEEVIISGADPVFGWTAHDTTSGRAIYKSTAMNWNLSDSGPSFGTAYRNQIFVDGRMMVLARWPNVPSDRITRLTYNDLALVTAASGQSGSTDTSAWIENGSVNSAFPSGYWNATRLATARVFLSPATMIWGMSVKVASQSSSRLNLDASGTGFSFSWSYYYPTTNNRFFLYDWYDALDTEGEYWKDTASNTLYLWTPGGGDPSTLNVEAKRRDFGLSLGQRSHLSFQGIRLFACTVDSDSESQGLEFSEIEGRYIAHIDNYAPTFTTAANSREFYLRGDGHVVKDSYFNGAAVTMIGASGINIRIENNVIRDFGYGHYGPAILARNGAVYGNRTFATRNQFLRNTAFNGGHTIVTTDPALDVKYNRIYNSHLRGSDVGAVGIASTDGLGSEIAYNVISDALGPKDSGVLYGGFGIYFDYECRNYTVHHNIVWNTTGSAYQLMPSRAAMLPGVTNLGMKFYHNTGDGDFGLIEPQDVPGVDVRNNLVRKFLNASGGTYSGLANVQFSNNTAYLTDGAAPFRDRVNHDLRFASGASAGVNAGAAISPYSDGFVGAAPDTGALEYDLAPFVAGATVTQRQLQALIATHVAQEGSFVDIQFGNLPEGRGLPSAFQARIGSEAFGGTLSYDYASATWRVIGINKGALNGLQPVTVRLNSSAAEVTLDSLVDVGGGLPAPEVAVRGGGVNILDGDATPSAINHTVFASAQAGDPSGTTQSFEIFNFGSLQLTLGTVSFTGSHAADFSVATAPASSIAPGSSTTMVVRFRPSAVGTRTATLSLTNNDADEATFDFVIEGYGTTPLPELNLPTSQLSVALMTDSTGSIPFPLQNIGLGNLTWNLSSASGSGIYSWADSATGGPAYAWYDIQTLGTRHWGTDSTADDVQTTVTLPFSFPFYGSNFTQLRIGSNGILSPGTGSTITAYFNTPLPSTSAPANLIAGFWDDLLVDSSAQIRSHAVDANTFVVLYDNVKSYSSVNRITFQIVLRSNGQITFQYRDNQFTRDYTIGLQNGSRTLGPQIAFSDYANSHTGLTLPVGSGINRALTFFPPATFLTGLSPNSGTLAANSSATPVIQFNTTGLAVGSYQSSLTLASNDADESSVQIPVTLQVVSNLPPVISVGQNPSGYVGVPFNYSIVASHAPTSFAMTSGSLPPGLSVNLTSGLLSGIPTTAGNFTQTYTATNGSGTSSPVAVSQNITDTALLCHEAFLYAESTNSPDPDGGLNSGNGLPATNLGGNPAGISTGLRGSWGTTLDVAAGLSYADAYGTLNATGCSGVPNNATWGGDPKVYRNMTIDPFLGVRIGGTSGGNLGADGSSLYLSVLARTASATARAWRLNLSGSNRNVFLENTATGWSLNENAAGAVATTGSLALNTTTLLVVRIDFVPGSGDLFRLWVNPALGHPLDTPNATLATSVDYGGFTGINPRPAEQGAMRFDEFRLGASHSVVTPYAPLPTGLQLFRTLHGLAADGSEDLLTPAGDGIPNLLKYAFNMVGAGAGQASSLFMPNTDILVLHGSAGLPFGNVEEGGKLQITFIRRKASSNPGITYTVEFSETLAAGSWTAIPSATESVTSLDATFERVTVTDSTSSLAKRFARVRIISN